MWRLAIGLLVLGACDDNGGDHRADPGEHWVDATVKLDGAFVVLDAHCTGERYGVEALVVETKQTFHCDRETKPLRIPAAKLGGTGKQTLTLGEEFRRKPPVKLAIDIPASAIVPYFNITKCDFESTQINLGITVDNGPEVDCWTAGGARAKVAIAAPPGATIALTGKTGTVPASGELMMVAELGASFLDLTIDDAVASGDGNPVVVPYKLTLDGKELAGKISVVTKFGQHAKLVENWLRDVATGRIERPAFTAPAAGARKTAILLPVLGGPEATDRRGTLRELGLLAIAKAGARTEHGTCQLDDKKAGSITAKRFLVEHEVDVVRLADGKVVAHKVFSPKPDECPFLAYVKLDNPEVENTPSSRDILAWLDTLTTAKLE